MLSAALSAIANGFEVDQTRVHLFLRALEEVAFDGAVGGKAEQARRGVDLRENGRVHAKAAMRLLPEYQHQNAQGWAEAPHR